MKGEIPHVVIKGCDCGPGWDVWIMGSMLEWMIRVLDHCSSNIVGHLGRERSHRSVREESVRELGLNVLWCRDHG